MSVVEDRPMMSVEYCLTVPVFHFWSKLTHPAARLCDSWATCYKHSGCLLSWHVKRTSS